MKQLKNLLYIKREMLDSDYIESDEEVSTNKERHSRLGEDNLDDTLEFDFSRRTLRAEEFKELYTKDSSLLVDQDTGHEVKATVEEHQDSKQMAKSIPQILLLRSENHKDPIPYVSSLDASEILEIKGSIESSNDSEY
nr:uncharacterized protein LOC132770026 isoform X2 [Anolis sagrei ordinatus]